MAYVRAKGNQVAIVHGERDPETKQVQQRVLFTLYSKAEALAAIGESDHWFQNILRDEHPGLRFDWKAIESGIRESMAILPDLYTYKKDRGEGLFRESLVAFARELLVADPQDLISSARLIQEHRHELEWLRKLLDWRLKLCEQEKHEYNQDNPFYWKAMMHRREVPPETWEELSELYVRGEHDKAKALARLLTEAWPNFAEGHSYLGLIARDRGQLPEALAHFEKALEVARTLFPKRIKKDMYWQDHDTRPFIRALCYLADTHNRMGDQRKALAFCDRLEKECGQDITAADVRIPILLNAGLWEPAAQAARYVHRVYPSTNLPLALALHESGEKRRALVHFLCGAIQFPRAARLLTGLRAQKPTNMDEARDYDHGQDFQLEIGQYLDAHRRTRRYFADVLKLPKVAALIDEYENVRRRWREDRSEDRTWFDRMHEMQSDEFADARAAEIWPELFR